MGGSENSVAKHTHQIATLNSGYSGNCTNFYSGAAKAVGGLENAGNVIYVQNANNGGAKIINDAGSAAGNRMPYITCYMWKRIK